MAIDTVDRLRTEVEARASDGAVRGRQLYGSFEQVVATGLGAYSIPNGEALHVEFVALDQDLDATLPTPTAPRDFFISHQAPLDDYELRVNGWLVAPGKVGHFAWTGISWTWRGDRVGSSSDLAVGLFRRHETQDAGDQDITISATSPWETRTSFQSLVNIWSIEAPIVVVDDDPSSPTFSRNYIGDSLLLTNDSWYAVTLDLSATSQTDQTLAPGEQCILGAQADGTWEKLYRSALVRRAGIADGAVGPNKVHSSWEIYYFSDHVPVDTDGDGRPRYQLESEDLAGMVQLDNNDTEELSIILTQAEIEGGRDLDLTNAGAYDVHVYTEGNLIAPMARIPPDSGIHMDKYPGTGQWVWLTRRFQLESQPVNFAGITTLTAADFTAAPPSGYTGTYTDSTWWYWNPSDHDSRIAVQGDLSSLTQEPVFAFRGDPSTAGFPMPAKTAAGYACRVLRTGSTNRTVRLFGLDSDGEGERSLEVPRQWARWIARNNDEWEEDTGGPITIPDADEIDFTPAGDIAATNVQAAIEELDTGLGNSAGVQAGDGVTIAADWTTTPGYSATPGGGTTPAIVWSPSVHGDTVLFNFATAAAIADNVHIILPTEGMKGGRSRVKVVVRNSNTLTGAAPKLWFQDPGTYSVGVVPAFNGADDANWDGPATLRVPGLQARLAHDDAGANAWWDHVEGPELVAPEAADTTTAGIVELATAAECDTGTDATRAITPDALAGSDHGKEVIGVLAFDDSESVATGDGAGDIFFRIPAKLNGWNLVDVAACHRTAGTGTGVQTTTFQVHNITQAVDMLSTAGTIDEDEVDTATAATPLVIDAANDDVATADQLRIDVDAIPSGAPQGLYVELTFQAP